MTMCLVGLDVGNTPPGFGISLLCVCEGVVCDGWGRGVCRDNASLHTAVAR